VVGTEPDLDLIKEVEQVTISALERPAWRFAAIPSEGITDAVEAPRFLIWQLLRWLLFGCKNSQERPKDDLSAKGQSGNAAGPTRRFHEPGHMGCRAVAPPNSARPMHKPQKFGLLPRFQSESLPSCKASSEGLCLRSSASCGSACSP
jgi:hypothetical protein